MTKTDIATFPTFEHKAACTGLPLTMFFDLQATQTRQAKKICKTCPNLKPCKTYAINHPTLHGVWGATTQKERVKLRNPKTTTQTTKTKTKTKTPTTTTKTKTKPTTNPTKPNKTNKQKTK